MQPSLVVLAAGIGSRYGGLKQVDGMGPQGEAIIEYAAYDAKRAGFDKVIFVIRRDIEGAFREKVGNRIAQHMRVAYAFQEMNVGLPAGMDLPERTKPWGTGHAILAAKEHIQTPFAVINADDYYGADAFQVMGDFLQHACTPQDYAMVAYRLANTLSENGTVSRGVCSVGTDGYLTTVTERTKIQRFETGIAHVFDDGALLPLAVDTPVSMNCWGFHHNIVPEIERLFHRFVLAHHDQPKSEFYIPFVVNDLLQEEKIRLKVLHSNSQWYGVTYPADKETVQQALADLAAQGVYKKGLW